MCKKWYSRFRLALLSRYQNCLVQYCMQKCHICTNHRNIITIALHLKFDILINKNCPNCVKKSFWDKYLSEKIFQDCKWWPVCGFVCPTLGHQLIYFCRTQVWFCQSLSFHIYLMQNLKNQEQTIHVWKIII